MAVRTEPSYVELCASLLATGEGADLSRLEAAIAAAPLACVVVSGAGGRCAPSAAAAKPLVELAQARGIATLLWQDAALARTLKADGVHLPASRAIVSDYATAREILDARAIVGADAGLSRHDAMTLGEAGASYVGFGASADLPDLDDARARRREMVAWWAEIFEVPCVALDVDDVEAASDLARAGADFLSVDVASDGDVARLAAIVAAVGGEFARG